MTARNRNAVQGVAENTFFYESVTAEPEFDPKDFELPQG